MLATYSKTNENWAISLDLRRMAGWLIFILSLFVPQLVLAQDAAPPPAFNSGDTAWIITATALVLMMTIPGVALFYSGMIHKESVLAAMAQSFAACCLVTVLWVVYGYSYAFTAGSEAYGRFIGGDAQVMLKSLAVNSASGTIPESVFIMFQMTFAIITCALILGAVANRIKFGSMLVFIGAWFTLVYVPVAHWVWGPGGLIGGTGLTGYAGMFGNGTTLDYAGGTVVHINAGIAGLMAALILGPRRGFKEGKLKPPYHIGFSLIGACLLWVGWFGFNAGSALSAGDRAGMAMLVTQVASAMAAIGWMVAEWLHRGKPTVIGIISGAVAGLVAITPASGFVAMPGALVIGAAGGVLCYGAVQLKSIFKIDDSLDVFAVHGVGGIIGAILTGVFADKAIHGMDLPATQVMSQIEGVLVTLLYSGAVSLILLLIIKYTIGLRVSDEDEKNGLDLALHGEQIH